MMAPTEAYELLGNMECDPGEQSRVNPSFTCGEILDVIKAAVAEIAEKRGTTRPLDDIMEKRVYQAVRNQLEPVF